MMKRLIKYFVNGLLFLVPLAITVYVVYLVFTRIDSTIRSLVGTEKWVTGLGVLISVAAITLIGMLSSLFITRPIMRLIEKIFGRLPLIKLLYSSIKDLVGAFVGEKKKFDQPVLVKLFPDNGVKALGFITRRSLQFIGRDNEVAVYFPQSYNFAGSMLIVPKEQIEPLSLDSANMMKFIVSGGISGPADSADEMRAT